MPLQPYKFVVIPIVQEVDARGNVTGENTLSLTRRDEDGTPIGTEEVRYTLFGVAELAKLAREFPKTLAELNAAHAAARPNRAARRKKPPKKKTAKA